MQSRPHYGSVKSENAPRSLPAVESFLRMFGVTVITWQPISCAWKILRSSRGLAQITSIPPAALQAVTACFMSGIGSRPVSAMRPHRIPHGLQIPTHRIAWCL
jgi:hypothetical protein